MKNVKQTSKRQYGMIWTLLAACVVGLASCENPDEDSLSNVDYNVKFPALNAVKPEDDVYKQKKSDKRGICTNFRIPEMPELLGPGISWCYDWGHSKLAEDRKQKLDANGITFYPMVWNAGYSQTDLASHIARDPKSNYMLGYNEPNLSDQANMTPAQAAQHWPGLVAAAKQIGLKIVGPAVNFGTLPGYSDPVKWYREFMANPNVNPDDIDAIALHSYMPGPEQVKHMIRSFDEFGKPIWLTEFANGNASSEGGQLGLMPSLCTYLEADPTVEKYSWFMDNVGANNNAPHFPLVTLPIYGPNPSETHVTDLGLVYIHMSTLDKSTYYDVDENIPAEHYSGLNVEDSAEGSGWEVGVIPRVTTDIFGTLEVYGFIEDKWIEYNVNIPKTALYRFDIRYAAVRDAVLTLSAPGVDGKMIQLPGTGANDEWRTVGAEVVLKKGRQTIRLTSNLGNACFNWFRVTSGK